MPASTAAIPTVIMCSALLAAMEVDVRHPVRVAERHHAPRRDSLLKRHEKDQAAQRGENAEGDDPPRGWCSGQVATAPLVGLRLNLQHHDTPPGAVICTVRSTAVGAAPPTVGAV